jgi:hypothetical protein
LIDSQVGVDGIGKFEQGMQTVILELKVVQRRVKFLAHGELLLTKLLYKSNFFSFASNFLVFE